MDFKTCLLFALLTFSMLTLAAAFTTTTRNPKPHICFMPLDHGACLDSVNRWWYNNVTGQCESFDYKGCLGNNNNFVEYGDCTRTCKYVTTTPKICYWNICDD